MTSVVDYLGPILDRKRGEVARRMLRAARWEATSSVSSPEARVARATSALSRTGAPVPRVIAEIKFRSPSAGAIRERAPGAVQAIARGYAEAGAAAVSVLCDRQGFGGGPLDLRRAASAIGVPVLFKEFVLDSVQIALARAMGAGLVLLLVRALSEQKLFELVDACLSSGLAPVVEAADERELEIALATRAPIVGVNARDLRTFRVDTTRALAALASVPAGRVAVHMSGIATAADLARVAASRADAVLVGEALMRASDPGVQLAALLADAARLAAHG